LVCGWQLARKHLAAPLDSCIEFTIALDYRSAEAGYHAGLQSRTSFSKGMIGKVLDYECVPCLGQDLRIGHSYFIGGGRLPQSDAYVYPNAVACRTDLYDTHQIAWQHALYQLRDLIEHLADVENIRKRIEKSIENLKTRSKIVLRRRSIGKMVSRPHGSRLYSSDGGSLLGRNLRQPPPPQT